ncbi:phagocyte signaling impaired [Brevipalpus obovatus]|uniref:phagocyte signaling impaired n=1 Tax=Brevipalpus obovatus TaxID=246614 RepID=UPI003D9DF88E
MAFRNMSDNSVNERRLRPIYDCLENGNNKKALQEAEKLLKKQKDLQCARALKGLALLRLHQMQKCMQILTQVHQEVPTDDCTLQAMAVCYKELNMVECIVDIYERASEKNPQSEELMAALFLAHVRMGNFKKQQQVALNLYKLKSTRNSYYFWAIMSVYMQAVTAKDQEVSKKMLLPLAQKMCKKIITDEKIHSENELLIYLMVLEKQGNYTEMLKVINSPLSKYLSDHLDFLKRRKAALYLKVGLYQEAFETLRTLIDSHTDQLEYYLQLCEAAFALHEKCSENQDDKVTNQSSCYVKRSSDIISRNISRTERSGSTGKKSSENHSHRKSSIRGPYIARIELYEMINAKESSTCFFPRLLSSISSNYCDLLFNYYVLFGDKEACYYDMAYLFNKYNRSSEDISEIIDRIKSSCDPRKGKISNLDEMFRYLCLIRLEHHCGKTSTLSIEETNFLIAELVDYCDQAMDFSSKSVSSDFQPCDTFMLTLFNIMVNQAMKDDVYLMNLICILERSLLKSPSNYASKLCLIKLYNSIGASKCSSEWFESLDIKHLQQDTLGYLILDALMMTGLFSLSFRKNSQVSSFYSVNARDSFDYLVSFYKIGNFNKIEEIMKYMERLTLSIDNSSAEVDRMVISSILKPKNWESFVDAIILLDTNSDKIYLCANNLCDNRDFTVFRIFDPLTQKKMDLNRERYFKDQKEWIRLRCLLMKTMISAFHLLTKDGSSPNNISEDVTSNGAKSELEKDDVFPKFLDHLRAKFNELKEKSLHFDITPLQGAQPSRLNYYLSRDYLEVILELFEEVKSIYFCSKENQPSVSKEWLKKLNNLVGSIVQDLRNVENLQSITMLLANIVFLVETFSFITWILATVHDFLKRKVALAKKNRKKNPDEFLDLGSLSEQFNSSLLAVDSSANNFLDSLSSFDCKLLSTLQPNLSCFPSKGVYLLDQQEFAKTFESMVKKIELSYNESTTEIRYQLTNRMKFLSSLKL